MQASRHWRPTLLISAPCAHSVWKSSYVRQLMSYFSGWSVHSETSQSCRFSCFEAIRPLPLQQVMGALCNGAITRIALNRCGIGGTSIECALPQHLRLFDLTGNHDIILAQWTARMAELQRCIISTDEDVARDGARCDMNVFKGEAVFAPPIDYGQYSSLLAPQLKTRVHTSARCCVQGCTRDRVCTSRGTTRCSIYRSRSGSSGSSGIGMPDRYSHKIKSSKYTIELLSSSAPRNFSGRQAGGGRARRHACLYLSAQTNASARKTRYIGQRQAYQGQELKEWTRQKMCAASDASAFAGSVALAGKDAAASAGYEGQEATRQLP